MEDREIGKVIGILKRWAKAWKPTAVSQVVNEEGRDPFKILISCLLSLRTKDETTHEAARRLFQLAHTPQGMLRLNQKTIEKAIYPVGFYRSKAKTILEICQVMVRNYGGRVPDTIDELLHLKGVGRKTANLVVTMAYGKPGICVDTHVHRITNRWGYVRTKTPDETEMALREKLPKRYWLPLNDLLVAFGQNLCKPVSPLCSRCPVERYCPKIGVVFHR